MPAARPLDSAGCPLHLSDMSTSRCAAALWVIVWFTACQENSTGTEIPPLCTAITSVSISPGLTPTFSWSPNCGANFLAVVIPAELPGELAQSVWGIQSLSGEVLSPITYGQAPPRTTVAAGPVPLEIGGSYEVIIGYIRGPLGIPLQNVRFQR
jgi:hypothetical protein